VRASVDAALQQPLVKLFNRVLSDYPMARARLAVHHGKSIAATVGPFSTRLRVDVAGDVEPVGIGAADIDDVAFTIPLSALPGLARRDEQALNAITFTGDSEFAATLSSIVRNVDWDIEQDLSRVVGDVAAHRIAGGARALQAWRADASTRVSANVAEYLVEENRTMASQRDIESLARANETLRDDIARAEARIAQLTSRG
jgi:ubiquinone biosynthesis accessory factor UbiJ